MKGEKEQKGFRQFISTEYKNLISYIKKYLNERYYKINAEDVLQDVALNILSRANIDDEVGNIAGYIYQSVRNRINDIKRKPIRELVFEELESEVVDIKNLLVDQDVVYKEFDDTLFYQKFLEELSLLNPNQQAVIIKTEIEGYAFEELAEEWKIPIGTLLSWKHRGMKKIKERLKHEEFYIVKK